MPVQLMITRAGLDALVNAQEGETEAIRITQVGLSSVNFAMAPTLEALPGEFKRLDTVSGQAVSETVIHMTAQDSSADIYELHGIGLYLADGTLFAAYAQAQHLFAKVSIAAFLFALDVGFGDASATDIVFGNTTFLLPPASETVKGVAEIATSQEAEDVTDHQRIITPLTLAQRLAALSAVVNQAIAALSTSTDQDLEALADGFDAQVAALFARRIDTIGLVTGGGDLSANRLLNVRTSTAADVRDGTANDSAVTPVALAGLARDLIANGYAMLPGCGGLLLQWGRLTAAPNASTAATFPIAFPEACFAVVPAGGAAGNANSQDNPPVLIEGSVTRFGFSIYSADDVAAGMRFVAVGK